MLKWLYPILVKMDIPEDLPATIRDVEDQCDAETHGSVKGGCHVVRVLSDELLQHSYCADNTISLIYCPSSQGQGCYLGRVGLVQTQSD